MKPAADSVARALGEQIEIVPYDPAWPAAFAAEAAHLRALLPAQLCGRIEHFGSTAVPGLAAKPIIDMIVEVPSLEAVAEQMAPLLGEHGYEFFWRVKDPGRPGLDYAWFIKRDASGRRTHHIHCLTAGAPDWERLRFRDYLRLHPEVAAEYGRLKEDVATRYPNDRRAYAQAKSKFIDKVMRRARAEL